MAKKKKKFPLNECEYVVLEDLKKSGCVAAYACHVPQVSSEREGGLS